MTKRHDRVRRIFIEAVELPPDRRGAFLDDACQGDLGLRGEVERLIAADADAASFEFKPPRSAPTRLQEGFVLAKRFRVVRFIAAGGMGDVYEVDDMELQERLALKTIRPEVVGDGRALVRFKREVQFAKRVSHPNVCRIHDLGTHRDAQADIVFLTMQLLDGETLTERLRRDGRISLPEALPLVVQMAEALGAAHNAGVIHRDFKTSNVMLTGARAVVTDFGLARSAAAGEEDSLTDSHHLIGTPAYMAPEQLTHAELTTATDIYALGLVMYEMLTGRKAFQGDTPFDSALKRLTEAPPPPDQFVPGFDPRWGAVILRCLEREPSKRYQRADEVIRALTLSAGSPTRTITRAVPRVISNQPLVRIATALLLTSAVVFAGVWTFARHRPPAAAVRWYEEGTRALQDGIWFTAMNALERAVQLDPNFTLAHARLAEAATELDYMDKAKTEMLRASLPAFPSFFLSAEEKLRLEAVYFVLLKDFSRAAAKYKELAGKVGSAERAAVLVDLGRAYESGGKFPEALASYSESIERDRQFAAAFLRRGILEGRQQQSEKATADFDAAEQLYSTEGKSEGLMEVLLQRSSLLRRAGKLAEARAPTEKSLEMARATGDEYHQIRALLALSYLSYNSGDTEGGQQQAQQAVDLSRRVGIDVLAASGLVDVGNALFNKGDNAAAEAYLRNAIEIARRFQAVRVEARAELTLGQVLEKEGRIEEAVSVSRAAVDGFQQVGDKSNANRAMIPVSRMLRYRGDYDAAATMFGQLLQVAEEAKDQGGIVFALQGVGSVRLLQEQYPAALVCFDRSTAVSHAIANQIQEGYSQVDRADALGRLGRYREAAESLSAAEALAQRLGGNKPLLANVYGSRAEVDLSQRRFKEAEEDVRRRLDSSGKTPATDPSAKRCLGLIRVRTGRAREGMALCEESVQQARKTNDVSLMKDAELALAEAKLQTGDLSGARTLAADLAQSFAIKGQNDSELRAMAMAAAASAGADHAGYTASAKAALDKLRQSLGAEAFSGFAARPDIRAILQRAGISDIR
jgi:eukaryotic-like serine/threonine-protein kinase